MLECLNIGVAARGKRRLRTKAIIVQVIVIILALCSVALPEEKATPQEIVSKVHDAAKTLAKSLQDISRHTLL